MIRRFLSLALLPVFAACSGSGSPTDFVPPPPPDYVPPASGLFADNVIDVDGEGTLRYFNYYVPPDLPENAPVLILLHSGGGNRTSVINGVGGSTGWRDVAEENGVLLILPNGTGFDGDPDAAIASWNDCRDDEDAGSTADDVAFLDALIDWALLEPDFVLDEDRVYVAGEANGGLMGYRAALELGDRLAGVATFIANRPASPEASCVRAENEISPEPVSMIAWVGTADTVMPFAGGDVSLGTGGTVLSAIETLNFWILRNQTSDVEPAFTYPDLDPTDGSTVISERYVFGADNSEVLYVTVLGGGHSMPTIRYTTLVGSENRDVESTTEAWAFLSTQRR